MVDAGWPNIIIGGNRTFPAIFGVAEYKYDKRSKRLPEPVVGEIHELPLPRFSYINSATPNFSVEYELLVGVDGARSMVRSEFLNTELFEFEQKYVANEYKSMFLPPPDRVSNIQLASDKNHAWRSNDGTSIILSPQLDGGFSGVLLFPRQHGVTELETPAAVLHFKHGRSTEKFTLARR